MANLIMNDVNLGPIIDAYNELPLFFINEHAVYRLYSRKFDITDGHGKDSDVCPVGFYKPAEGSKWWHNEVERGSYGQVFDGFDDCPVQRMREGRPNASWDPVPCEPEEASGIFYYDFAADKCFFAHHDVGYGGVNLYTEEMLDRDLGTSVQAYYTRGLNKWVRLDAHPDVMVGSTPADNGKEGIVPKPFASDTEKVLLQSAQWSLFKVWTGSRDPFLDATGRTLENIGDLINGMSVVTNADLTIYNHCDAVIEWTIKRTDATHVAFCETAREYTGAILDRSATVECTDGVLTSTIISNGTAACAAKGWVCTNEHYDNTYIDDPSSPLVFGPDMSDYPLPRAYSMEHMLFEFDHAARFEIDGTEVYGNLNSIASVVKYTLTVVQEMIGTIDGAVRSTNAATGHYMRIGHVSTLDYETFGEAMPHIVWGDWTDVRHADLCTVYLTQEEYDSMVTPDPDIIYTIID